MTDYYYLIFLKLTIFGLITKRYYVQACVFFYVFPGLHYQPLSIAIERWRNVAHLSLEI